MFEIVLTFFVQAKKKTSVVIIRIKQKTNFFINHKFL